MSAARNGADFVPHPVARALDRYGIVLTKTDLAVIVNAIQNNHGTLAARDLRGGASAWWLNYRATKLLVLISPDFWRVVTFLPPDHDFNRERKRPKYRKHKSWRKGKAVYIARAA